jgi:hypothetical protein
MKIQAEASISFESVFGASSDDIPIAQVENFLDKVVQEHFQQTKSDPNQLIRFVDRGKALWMTAAQAEHYISQMDEDHRKSFEKKLNESLRGDSQVLSQEIKILLVLVFGTLQRFNKEQLIPYQEIQRIDLVLNRQARTVYTTLDQLRQLEQHMRDTRRKNPVADEFERKMAQFLVWQKQGENEKAAILAKDLVTLKKKYLIVSKVLSNDKNQSQTYRLEIQRHKKIILSNHRYLAAQREGVLQDEQKDLQTNIQNVRAIIEKEQGKDREKYERMLKESESKHTQNVQELSVVQREKLILEKKEKETDELIQKMESELSDHYQANMTQQKEQPAGEKPQEVHAHEPDVQEDEETQKKSTKRMVRARER